MALWSFYISNGSSGNYKDGIYFESVDPYVAATLYIGAFNEFEKMHDELDESIFYYVYNVAHGTDSISVSSLSTEQFCRVYDVTKSNYDDFIKYGAAHFNLPHAGDVELNAERRKYFDLYIKLLEADPRLKL